MSNIDQASAPAGGFGKMLNSLQGLQQRLEDFSIADVTNAEANAQTLILRLRQFQDTIAAVALLKNAAADIDRSIAEVAPVDVEIVDPDSLENHPQLHAIVKVSKLIKLQKLMTALKAGADEGEAIAVPDLMAATERSPQGQLSETPPAKLSDTSASIEADQDAAAKPADRAVDEPIPASLVETRDSITLASAARETARETPIDNRAATDFPTALAEFETAAAEIATTSAQDNQTQSKDFPAPAEHTPASLATANLPIVEPAPLLPQSARPKHAPAAKTKKQSKSHDRHAAPRDESKALARANESFDLRLLDDLVSNYGEFAANPNLPATVKKKDLQHFEPAPNAAAELRPEPATSDETISPSVKKDGDFDRQLKKIIKDYGEYDLYSDKPAANIKKAGILAFVFLGLVFGGIYFFTAPPSTAKTAPVSANSVNQAVQSDSTATGAKEAKGTPRDARLGTAQNLEKPTAKK